MSHTKRIYNNPRLKKAQRYNIDDGEIHTIVGIPYTRRSWICMGKCPRCRDPNREPRLVRKRRKEQLRFELINELKKDPDCEQCPDISIIDYDQAFCSYCAQIENIIT